MKRLEFLDKARQLACEQISNSSCLPNVEFKNIMKLDDTEEVALYRKAKQILEDAGFDMENTFDEVKALEGKR